MVKKIFNILFVITLLLFFSTNSYAGELSILGTGKTIKELNNSIKILDNEKNKIENDFSELNTDLKLKTFLRKNISRFEFNKIKELVINYNKNEKELNEKLLLEAKKGLDIKNTRKKLLENKRIFYNGLIPFININHKKEYLEYIKRDAELFKKKNIISVDIEVKKDILDNKVSRIESEIKKHKDYINKSIKNIIDTRLEQKINNLKNNDGFKFLSNESKVKVLEKTIRKIKIKLSNYTNKINLSGTGINQENTNIDNKLETYKIAIEKLENFKNIYIK
ncbi:hypothetical protein LRZ95_01405 [Candidatus Gracilibacteria bacterium]|nr:hypothetical protein [Candidatus Gracilibacteria bacterium]